MYAFSLLAGWDRSLWLGQVKMACVGLSRSALSLEKAALFEEVPSCFIFYLFKGLWKSEILCAFILF